MSKAYKAYNGSTIADSATVELVASPVGQPSKIYIENKNTSGDLTLSLDSGADITIRPGEYISDLIEGEGYESVELSNSSGVTITYDAYLWERKR